MPFRALEFLGTGTVGSDYLDVIVREGKDVEGLDALADALAKTRLVLEFGQVRREFSSVASLTARLAARGWSDSETPINPCPLVDLAGHSWESYLTSLGPEHRFQRRLRNLEKRFDVRLDLVQTEAERREALDALVAFHTSRWRERGGSQAFGSPELLSFHDEVSQLTLQRGWLRLFVLRLGGRPATVFYGYRYGRAFYFYQSGFDPTFAKESVGLITIGLTIRRAIEEGAMEYDLLHGTEPYKFLWMPRVRELARFELFPPGTGGAVCQRVAAASGRIRRAVRRLVGDSVAERLVSQG
jgi:CelD/BcsL family acetyltransferase involved in cellulose biosynthesis